MNPSYSELRAYLVDKGLIRKYVEMRDNSSIEKRKLYYLEYRDDHINFELSGVPSLSFPYCKKDHIHNLVCMNKDEFIRIYMNKYIENIIYRWLNCCGVTI